MNIPNINKTTKEDIIKYIKRISPNYTPEWRFDDENYDIGTALLLIYADMMFDTVKRFNHISEKNMISFFNKIGAKLLPAIPAVGYATLELVNQFVDGVEVRKGTQLIADSEENQNIIFETLNDMYVTPAKLSNIFLSDKENDIIVDIYNQDINDKQEFYMFDLKGENIQKHEFYICHECVLYVETEAYITIKFVPYHIDRLSENIYKCFADENKVQIQYYTEYGFISFENRCVKDGNLILYKGISQPETKAGGIEDTNLEDSNNYYWIKFIVNDIKDLDNIPFENIFISSKADGILPQLVQAAGIERKVRQFFPFGEKFTEFTDLYIASNEVLGKKGAWVQLSFDIDFIKIPITANLENEIDWKMIMKKEDFKFDLEYDITIEEVIWEYFNGFGWKRLFSNEQYKDIFNISDNNTSGRRTSIQFKCPLDIQKFIVNSTQAYYIRARILKVNNAFKLKGNYITPILSRVNFRYEYINNGMLSKYMIIKNNLEVEYIKNSYNMADNFIIPFKGLGENKTYMYFGFEIAPIGGPIKILFSMFDTISSKLPRINYQYYGSNRWNDLNVIDETENFRKTGIITMIGNPDFKKLKLFGKELYWIRLNDTEKFYNNTKNNNIKLPCILGIYINSVEIIAIQTKDEEYFSIDYNKENFKCYLKNKNIYNVEVWVNEIKTIDKREINEIEKNYQVEYKYNDVGIVEDIWVKWFQQEDFSTSLPSDRYFIIDKNDGIISFSNKIYEVIPPYGIQNAIKVKYSCGGGIIGNLQPNKIRRLNKTIGFINNVSNREVTTGGCDKETIDEAIKRNACALKHQHKAVTARDYELLAYEATRNILKAKCISNINKSGKKEYGCITLVILQKDFITGRKYFDSIKNQVYNYIKSKTNSNIIALKRFEIIEPQFLELSVNINISVKDFNIIFDVRKEVLNQIYKFLDPLIGNFDGKGWDIGKIPNSKQIQNILKSVKGIHFIKNIRITAYKKESNGMIEINLENNNENLFAIALNGKHEIFIEVE